MRNVLVRAELVRRKKLPLTALWPCRSWCLAQLPTALTFQVHEQVLVPVCTMSSLERKQWLIDTVDALALCASPAVGLQFLDRMLLLWHAPELHPHFLSIVGGATLITETLPALLDSESLRDASSTLYDHISSLLGASSAQSIVPVLSFVFVALKSTHKPGSRVTVPHKALPWLQPFVKI